MNKSWKSCDEKCFGEKYPSIFPVSLLLFNVIALSVQTELRGVGTRIQWWPTHRRSSISKQRVYITVNAYGERLYRYRRPMHCSVCPGKAWRGRFARGGAVINAIELPPIKAARGGRRPPMPSRENNYPYSVNLSSNKYISEKSLYLRRLGIAEVTMIAVIEKFSPPPISSKKCRYQLDNVLTRDYIAVLRFARYGKWNLLAINAGIRPL